ncbi:hypothetical protein [Sphingomonas abietis]|uniref:Uncharacterized protein n=1 Tax=Sphingomonas abietis TaxID=3012344 RepID=A0ABY7NP06_9SPHN|nr:hypothetical protein [Sphingomonas abietis]WBO22685.1 hypothetical protein PBT88_00580 [Sphingomonas abietis]
MTKWFASAAVLATGFWMAVPAHAANDIMKECGAKYQAAKAANTLGGKNWAQFLAQCRGGQVAAPVVAAPVAAARPVAAVKPVAAAKPASHLPGAQSPAMVAMHDRQRKCGQQWSADKAAGKIPAGQKWPQYWSACNTRLKG